MAKRQVLHRVVTQDRTPLSGQMGGTRFKTTTHEERSQPEPSKDHKGVPLPRMITGRSPSEHALVAEFLIALVIISIRAVADYVPQGGGSEPGQEQPAKGAHPLTMLAATLIVYFVLALAARTHSFMSRAAVLFGLLMDLTLLTRSGPEMQIVANWFANRPNAASQTGGQGSASGSGSAQSGPFWVTSNGVVASPSKPSGAVGPFPTQAAAEQYVQSHTTQPPIG